MPILFFRQGLIAEKQEDTAVDHLAFRYLMDECNSLDPNLIKGSHELIKNFEDDWPLLITQHYKLEKESSIGATDVID